MIRSACQQMSRLAAILAVALLCAQTLVVVHEHELSDGVLCAVCSTPTEDAAGSNLATTAADSTTAIIEPTLDPSAPAQEAPSLHRARAPPIA